MENDRHLADRDRPAAHGGYSKHNALPRPSMATVEIIRGLDIRYPPNATVSEDDREAQILLLASDVADINPNLLRDASREWVRTKAFLPKASELRALAGQIRREASTASNRNPNSPENLRRLADEYNMHPNHNPGLRWVVKGTDLKVVPVRDAMDAEYGGRG